MSIIKTTVTFYHTKRKAGIFKVKSVQEEASEKTFHYRSKHELWWNGQANSKQRTPTLQLKKHKKDLVWPTINQRTLKLRPRNTKNLSRNRENGFNDHKNTITAMHLVRRQLNMQLPCKKVDIGPLLQAKKVAPITKER